MKVFHFLLLAITFSTVNAQTKVIKYYDANWIETPKEKAVFYADFIKDGEYYNCTSYWINTRTVRGKSTYADTVMQSPIGLQVIYFKNGHAEDSSSYEGKGLKYSYRYYPNNQLAFHYYLPENKKEGIVEGYDESGKKIKNYIFEKNAEFKGGQKAWVSYLNKHATKDFPAKGNSEEAVSVQVQFIIDENGDVTHPKILKSSGYKNVDNDALQIIGDSPPWKNAIQYNKPVKVYRIQPITYTLRPEKK
jgi:TonB family protein